MVTAVRLARRTQAVSVGYDIRARRPREKSQPTREPGRKVQVEVSTRCISRIGVGM
jgi:hypothetical protein